MMVSFVYKGKTFTNWNIREEKTRKYLESLGVDIVPVAREEIQKQLLGLEKQRLQKVLEQYGYNGLADVYVYVSQKDQEAKAILSWYTNSNGNGYDDLIWNWIENELPKYQTVDELLAIDLKQVEEEIFNQSVQNNPLP